MNNLDTSLLPGILRELAELIGITGTMTLVDEYGGVRLYVPMTLPEDHPLINLIGPENAQKVIEGYGGEKLEIPKAIDYMRQIRDIEIRSQWPALSQRQLALKYNTTERNIRLILGKCERNENQMPLFE